MTPIATQNLSGTAELIWREIAEAPMTLDQAHKAYDRGEIIIVTGRKDHLRTVYIIPRRQGVPPGHQPYFQKQGWREQYYGGASRGQVNSTRKFVR